MELAFRLILQAREAFGSFFLCVLGVFFLVFFTKICDLLWPPYPSLRYLHSPKPVARGNSSLGPTCEWWSCTWAKTGAIRCCGQRCFFCCFSFGLFLLLYGVLYIVFFFFCFVSVVECFCLFLPCFFCYVVVVVFWHFCSECLSAWGWSKNTLLLKQANMLHVTLVDQRTLCCLNKQTCCRWLWCVSIFTKKKTH